MDKYSKPEWMAKYANGQCVSQAQASAAYSTYYNLDGSADFENDIVEQLPAAVPMLRPYASRTGTKTTLENMRKLGWSILVSAAGVLRTEGFKTWYRWTMAPGAHSSKESCLMKMPFRERSTKLVKAVNG